MAYIRNSLDIKAHHSRTHSIDGDRIKASCKYSRINWSRLQRPFFHTADNAINNREIATLGRIAKYTLTVSIEHQRIQIQHHTPDCIITIPIAILNLRDW